MASLFHNHWCTYLPCFKRVEIRKQFLTRVTGVRPDFFLKVSCVFIFLTHNLIENCSKMPEILLWTFQWGLKRQKRPTFFIIIEVHICFPGGAVSALKNGRKWFCLNPSPKKNGRKWFCLNPSPKKNGRKKPVNLKKITEKKEYPKFPGIL